MSSVTEVERKVEFHKKTRKEWLKEMPELIKKLVSGYNFYYGDTYSRIKKDIKEHVLSKANKNSHKICVYTQDTRWFLVVYAKKCISIYYCDEYTYSTNEWRNIKRFLNKFNLAYEEAVKLWKKRENYTTN